MGNFCINLLFPFLSIVRLILYVYKHLTLSDKPYQPEIKIIENKNITRPINAMPRILACNTIT